MRRRTTATESAPAAAGAPVVRWGPGARGSPLFRIAVVALAAGCSRPPPPFAPAPAAAPGNPANEPAAFPAPADAAPPRRPDRVAEVERTSAEATPSDPIVSSPAADDDAIRERVAWWLEYWGGRGAGEFERALARMGRYEAHVDREIEARGLPPSLRYLPIIEAGYYPTARSPVGAAGLWQFMPETAEWLDLEVAPVVDERLDPFLATAKALDYLRDLHRRFDSWFLALAAYNGGPSRVARLLRELPDARPGDDLFHRIRPRLPAETRDFVPKYLAAVRIAADPTLIGLERVAKEPPLAFDSVVVEGAASLDVVARAAGVAEAEVRRLNPHLVLDLTPAGRSTAVRVPPGARVGFGERFAAIPPDSRVTLTQHRVSAGETLSHVALAYRVSLAELRAANPDVEPRRVRIGARLVIPRTQGERSDRASPAVAPQPRVVRAQSVAAPAASDSERPEVHVVREGESLWLIARYYGVELERLRRHNDLGEEALLRPGDVVRIPPSG